MTTSFVASTRWQIESAFRVAPSSGSACSTRQAKPTPPESGRTTGAETIKIGAIRHKASHARTLLVAKCLTFSEVPRAEPSPNRPGGVAGTSELSSRSWTTQPPLAGQATEEYLTEFDTVLESGRARNT